MNKTIGILAHVDCGKTTFCEQLLYHTNAIRKRGRVDNKDTFLDNHDIEKQRGITIFSEQATFKYNESNYYLIDTPGHIDFSPDMERSISIMDYAVIIISVIEKVQSHTKTVFRLLRKYNVPTIFFVNKIDREGANLDEVISDIKNSLTSDVINISDNLNLDLDNILSEDIIEFIAERDDYLFERYLEEDYDKDLWIDSIKKMVKESKIYPLMYGSALQDIGINEFIKRLDYLTHTNYNKEDDFIGKVYKVKYDDNKNRVTYIKALQGSIKVKDEVNYSQGNNVTEKINEIRIYNSNKYTSVNEVYAGEVFAICGLSEAKIGDFVLSPNISKVNLDKLNEDIESIKKILYLDSPDLWIDFSDKIECNNFDEMVLFFAIKYNYSSIIKHAVENNLIDLDSPSRNKTFSSIRDHLISIANKNNNTEISNYLMGINEDVEIEYSSEECPNSEIKEENNSYIPESLCPNCNSNVFNTGYTVSEEITYKFSKESNKAIPTSNKILDSVSCSNCGTTLKGASPSSLESLCTVQNCVSCNLDLTTTGIVDKVRMIYDKESNGFINYNTSYHCSNCDKELSTYQIEYFNL